LPEAVSLFVDPGEQPNSFIIFYTPHVCGRFFLHLVVDNTEISGSPFLASFTSGEFFATPNTLPLSFFLRRSLFSTLVGLPLACPQHSTAEGHGLTTATVGSTSSYTITFLDQDGNPADPLGLEIVFGDQFGNEMYVVFFLKGGRWEEGDERREGEGGGRREGGGKRREEGGGREEVSPFGFQFFNLL
jgi:hypothetical protein